MLLSALWRDHYAAFQRAAREDKTYPATMEGFASFLANDYTKMTGTAEKDEVNRRRRFYLYVAPLGAIG